MDVTDLLPKGRVIQASFFWKNDQPGGLGFTLGPPGFSSDELTGMFSGEVAKYYMRESDKALGTNIVAEYLAQLQHIAAIASPTIDQVVLAALNILWLSSRGFIPNDEFNGPQFLVAH